MKSTMISHEFSGTPVDMETSIDMETHLGFSHYRWDFPWNKPSFLGYHYGNHGNPVIFALSAPSAAVLRLQLLDRIVNPSNFQEVGGITGVPPGVRN